MSETPAATHHGHLQNPTLVGPGTRCLKASMPAGLLGMPGSLESLFMSSTSKKWLIVTWHNLSYSPSMPFYKPYNRYPILLSIQHPLRSLGYGSPGDP